MTIVIAILKVRKMRDVSTRVTSNVTRTIRRIKQVLRASDAHLRHLKLNHRDHARGVFADRRIAFAAGAMDVAGERHVRTVHPGNRRLEFRRRPLGGLLVRQAALLRSQQRRGR